MPNSSVFIFLMLRALYRMICKNSKSFFCKNSLNVQNVKPLSNFFFQHFWLFYAFLVRMTACTLHIKWFPWHQEPKWPQWPQQPQQPQWPQWPLQPHFIKKLTELDVSINPDTKMTYPGLLMWDGSSKIHYFIDFWQPFWWRLWRTRMLLLTKSKGQQSNVHCQWTCRYLLFNAFWDERPCKCYLHYHVLRPMTL